MEELVAANVLDDDGDVGELLVSWRCLKKSYFDAEFNLGDAFLFRSRQDGFFYPGTVATKEKLDECIRLETQKGKALTPSGHGRKNHICCFFVNTRGKWSVEWISFTDSSGMRNIYHLSNENIEICLRLMQPYKDQEFLDGW